MIIGLHGPAQSGKDTVCTFIQDWAKASDRMAERDAFADRLKVSAAHALGVMDDEINFCNVLKQKGSEITVTIPQADGVDEHGYYVRMFTGREYLQWYGTQAHRDVFGHDFWLQGVLPDPYADWAGRETPFDLLVITDVRFDNEAEHIKKFPDSEIWQIKRQGSGAGTHSSEIPIHHTLIDRTIENNGTLYELRDKVSSLLDRKVYA